MKRCRCCKKVREDSAYFTMLNGKPMSKCKLCITEPGHQEEERRQKSIDRYDEVLRLYYRGLKYREIALAVGKNINTVKTHIKRGLKATLSLPIRHPNKGRQDYSKALDSQ